MTNGTHQALYPRFAFSLFSRSLSVSLSLSRGGEADDMLD
jgi:hypothetical protein